MGVIMPLSVRIASFNCENFFTRALLLNMDNQAAKPKLEALAKLQGELCKPSYSAAKIMPLYNTVKDYVIVRENKGKLFKKSAGKLALAAAGVGSWDGWLELKPDKLSPVGQDNTARVLEAINADIAAIVEMDDRTALQRLGRSNVLGAKKYAHAMLIDGNDDRGIDVGVLSRHQITDLRSNVDAKDQTGAVFSRDCLETRVDLPGGHVVHVLVNHLKSQGYGPPAANDAKRLRQSQYIANSILPRYNLSSDFVVVAGDFNADRAAANAASIQPLTSHPQLVDVISAKLPATDQWSYAYKNKKQRLDYLLCSTALAAHCTSAGIERRGMFDLAKLTGNAQQPFPTVKDQKTSASDHAGIFADFALP
jgi:endonuclease/exonuclease/phosphatase family metal-dependent hydrolase